MNYRSGALVKPGAAWCSLVQPSEAWRSLVQSGAVWCSHTIWRGAQMHRHHHSRIGIFSAPGLAQ